MSTYIYVSYPQKEGMWFDVRLSSLQPFFLFPY